MASNATTDLHPIELARRDFACYASALYPKFTLAPHQKLIVDKLEAVERGEITRLMIFLPPRHGKSLLGSTLFPAWYLGKHPEHHIVFITYGQELSDDFGRQVRNLVVDPYHEAIFPRFKLSNDATAHHRFSTKSDGAYFAVGRGGAITGRGAHLLIVDDPLKDRAEADSVTTRNALRGWFTSVAYTRLMEQGKIILIQTRWHQDDLAGWLLKEHSDDNWDVLCLPAIAEADEVFRKEGDALWPQQFPLSQLERIRKAIGGRDWQSLYQQQPAAAEGTIFRREWWQYYEQPFAGSRDYVVQSWDTAFKSGKDNDYSVCATWIVSAGGYYLDHLWRDRVPFPQLKQAVRSLAEAHKPNAILIEDKASGQSLVQELRTTHLPILAIKTDRDKIARAHAVTPMIESGRVFLPRSASWTNDLVHELAVFPFGRHDDIVDAVTQALSYLGQRPAPSMHELFMIMNTPRLNKEDLWEKAQRGYPITEEEFRRM